MFHKNLFFLSQNTPFSFRLTRSTNFDLIKKFGKKYYVIIVTLFFLFFFSSCLLSHSFYCNVQWGFLFVIYVCLLMDLESRIFCNFIADSKISLFVLLLILGLGFVLCCSKFRFEIFFAIFVFSIYRERRMKRIFHIIFGRKISNFVSKNGFFFSIFGRIYIYILHYSCPTRICSRSLTRKKKNF